MPASEFTSLAVAQAYVDTVREKIALFETKELIDALKRLDCAYHVFPELNLYYPRQNLVNHFRSAVELRPDHEAIPLLMYCVALDPSCATSMRSLCEKIAASGSWCFLSALSGFLSLSGVDWNSIEPLISELHKQDRVDTIIRLLSRVVDFINLDERKSAPRLAVVLADLLSVEYSFGTDKGALAKTLQSARRRLQKQRASRTDQKSREVLLAMADRLRIAPSTQRAHPHRERIWPSGRISFDEFLRQWPCAVELSVEVDDPAFIAEAHRAILLREPNVVEMEQYLKLLRQGGISKSQIVEDLLGSEELYSLERRVRVILDNHVITEPGKSPDEEMVAVIWPYRPSG